jgi:hypothetical protein
MMTAPAILGILLSGLAVQAAPAIPKRADNSFTLPDGGHNYQARSAAIVSKQKGWLYEEFPIGGAFYPTGPLANATISQQQAQWFPIVIEHAKVIAEESETALAGIIAVRQKS